jgi:undecaprenyl pyrophosphate synthase
LGFAAKEPACREQLLANSGFARRVLARQVSEQPPVAIIMDGNGRWARSAILPA